jgi:hypothetical protein
MGFAAAVASSSDLENSKPSEQLFIANWSCAWRIWKRIGLQDRCRRFFTRLSHRRSRRGGHCLPTYRETGLMTDFFLSVVRHTSLSSSLKKRWGTIHMFIDPKEQNGGKMQHARFKRIRAKWESNSGSNSPTGIERLNADNELERICRFSRHPSR